MKRKTDLTWRTLLGLAAGANLVMLLVTTVALNDSLALALAAIVLAGLGLLRFRNGLLGAFVLIGVSADITAYTLTGAVTNIVNGESAQAVVVPSALAALSLAGLVAGLAVLVRRRDPQAGGTAARVVGLSAVALFVLLLAAGMLAEDRTQQVPKAADIVLVTENLQYSQTDLSARAGTVTVSLENRDLFWHTFSVDALGVDLKVPVGGKQRVTFNVTAGTYKFYCSIPGHEIIGMRGTLTVR